MILIWNMGLGGIQKRIRDIVIDMVKNRPDWDIYMTVKYKNPDYFSKDFKSNPRVHFNYFSDYKRKNFVLGLVWIIKEYLKIQPTVCLTFGDHFSVIMIFIRKLFFWQKTRIVLNEGVLMSKCVEIYRKNKIIQSKG